MLLCPTVTHNKTLDGFVDNEPRIFVIACQQNEVEVCLKMSSFFFKGTNKLIILDDYAALKDVKGCTSQLVSLGFSTQHTGISVWVLTQQIASIAKPFLEIVLAIVLFYKPSSKTMKAIHIASDVPPTKTAKNPDRVHAGKKLAEHNHKAHEAKDKLKRQQQTKRLLCRTTNHPLTSKKGCLAAKFFPPGDSSSHLLGRTTRWLQCKCGSCGCDRTRQSRQCVWSVDYLN